MQWAYNEGAKILWRYILYEQGAGCLGWRWIMATWHRWHIGFIHYFSYNIVHFKLNQDTKFPLRYELPAWRKKFNPSLKTPKGFPAAVFLREETWTNTRSVLQINHREIKPGGEIFVELLFSHWEVCSQVTYYSVKAWRGCANIIVQ